MVDKVSARRHPHQVLIAAVLVGAGVPVVLGGPQPGSLTAALPAVLVALWGTVLVVCGSLVIAAAVAPSPLTALYLELVADPPLALMCAVYASSIWLIAGTRGLVPALFTLGFALAFAWRGWQVRRSLTELRRRLREGRHQ